MRTSTVVTPSHHKLLLSAIQGRSCTAQFSVYNYNCPSTARSILDDVVTGNNRTTTFTQLLPDSSVMMRLERESTLTLTQTDCACVFKFNYSNLPRNIGRRKA